MCAVALGASVFAGAAGASKNVGPSSSAPVKVGIPFTGTWEGTPYGHSYSPSHWWRLPIVVRSGDTIQLAVDNRLGLEESVELCLIAPVDDFGASDAFGRCNSASTAVGYGSQDRIQLTYEGASGLAFLAAWLDDYCCLDPGEKVGSGYGQYTVTIEQITTLVNIGMAVPPVLPPTFTLIANLAYGDNTPAADGIPAFLQWRFVAPRGSEPEPFSNLITTTSLGGAVTFVGSAPTPAEGRAIQLRACVAQPGSAEVRCAESVRTTVAASLCTRALASRLVKARSVKRLKKRLRKARRAAAKRKIRRKLGKQKRRLAKAKRSVRAHCA